MESKDIVKLAKKEMLGKLIGKIDRLLIPGWTTCGRVKISRPEYCVVKNLSPVKKKKKYGSGLLKRRSSRSRNGIIITFLEFLILETRVCYFLKRDQEISNNERVKKLITYFYFLIF